MNGTDFIETRKRLEEDMEKRATPEEVIERYAEEFAAIIPKISNITHKKEIIHGKHHSQSTTRP